MKSVIIVFGKPNAGKGTRLSNAKKEMDNFCVLSVGDLLREERKNGTELGKLAASFMDSGKLVPNEVINKIVINGIENSTVNIILDGFPRTKEQAIAMLASGISPEFVINLDVPDEIIIERAAARLVCSQCGETFTTNDFKKPKIEGICDNCNSTLIKRSDDDPTILKKRLITFKEETEPVLTVLAEAGIEINTITHDCGNVDKAFIHLLNQAFN